jgi:ion channel-forming bestrophin family protein
MVIYNPKDWWKLIFAFHKSDTFRMMLPGIFGVSAYTALVAFLENDYFNATFKNTTAIHTLVGFVLSLLLVFRTNTAYERWWEGRKLWGTLVNNTRNLALKISTLVEEPSEREVFKFLIIDFVQAAKEHLRRGVVVTKLSPYSQQNLPFSPRHIPLALMGLIYKQVNELLKTRQISQEQALYLNEELRSFMDVLGGCERIKKTPIPYSYSLFLKKVIFVYVFTMPIGFVREFGYWACPIVSLIFYVFASIELIAEEIEDPFGVDANDLPLDTICDNLKDNLREIF